MSASDSEAIDKKNRISIALRLLIFALLSISVVGLGEATGDWQNWVIRGLTGLLFLIVAAGYTWLVYYKAIEASSVSNPPQQLDSHHAAELQRLASQSDVSASAARIFALAITSPGLLRRRVTEHYATERRTLRQTVSTEVQIPKEVVGSEEDASDLKEGFPYPIVTPLKGEFNDELLITSESGERLPVLNYSEYLELVARIFRALLMMAFGVADLAELGPAQQESARRAEKQALVQIMYRGEPDQAAVQRAIEAISNLTVTNTQAKTLMVEMTRKLSFAYAIVATVPYSLRGRILLTYSRSMIPGLQVAHRKDNGLLATIQDVFKFALGARPVDVTLSLENACFAQSYHLNVTTSNNLYLASQRIIGMDSYAQRRAPGTDIPPYYRLRRRLGQPYAHFYSRYVPEVEQGQEPPRLRLRFFEVPPGSLLGATIASIAAAVLIWIVAFVLQHAQSQNAGTDVPAILLAFPAVAAAWLGSGSSSDQLLEGTFVARVSLLTTTAISVLASGCFMLTVSTSKSSPIGHSKLPQSLTPLGISDPTWATLALISSASALFTAYVCMMRIWQYRFLSTRIRENGGVTRRG